LKREPLGQGWHAFSWSLKNGRSDGHDPVKLDLHVFEFAYQVKPAGHPSQTPFWKFRIGVSPEQTIISHRYVVLFQTYAKGQGCKQIPSLGTKLGLSAGHVVHTPLL